MLNFHVNKNFMYKRISLGLSQSDLADAVGTTQTTISAIECGKWFPSVKLALLISYRLNCTVEDLFYFTID